MTDAERQARIDLAAAYRLACLHDLNEGVCNHFTLVLPDRPDHFLLIGYGTHWSRVRASDLLVVDLDGNLIAGEGIVEPTALYIHARIHKARPDLRCLMHTHQPYTLALAMTEGGRLEPASQNALRFTSRIAYDWDYCGLALDETEGDRLVAAMGGNDILLMGNHGVLVGGPDVAKTYDDLYYLERAALVQVLAESTGRPLRLIPPEIQRETARGMSTDNMQRYAQGHFDGLKRMLDEIDPDYKA